jgi:replicative DNA helicase
LNWELALVRTILTAENPVSAYKAALDLGIAPKTLSTAEGRKSWRYLDSFYVRTNNFGKVPSLTLFEEANRTIELVHSSDDLPTIVNEIIETHLELGVHSACAAWNVELENGPAEALVTMVDRLQQLQGIVTKKSDVLWNESAVRDLAAEFDRFDAADGIGGIPFPWETLTRDTGGIQEGDLIMFWGLPKHRKTFILLVIAAHLYTRGYRVLLYSKEMMWRNTLHRLASIIARVDYARFKKHELTRTEQIRMLNTVERVVGSIGAGQILFTDLDRADGSPGTADSVREKIISFKADIAVLDSAYMLGVPGSSDEMGWKSFAGRTRALKVVSKGTKVPILIGMQSDVRRVAEAAKSGDDFGGIEAIAGATSMIQDLDMGVNVVTDESNDTTSLRTSLTRESNADGIVINSRLCADFRERPDLELFGLKEVIDARKRRNGDDAETAERRQPRRRRNSTSLAQRALGHNQVADAPDEDAPLE